MELIIKDIDPSVLLAAHYGLAGPKNFRTQLTGFYFTKIDGEVCIVTNDGYLLKGTPQGQPGSAGN